MFTKCIVVQLETGISIIYPAQEMFVKGSDDQVLTGLTKSTDEEILQFIIDKDVPKGYTYTIVEVTDLPSNRVFRNAWTLDETKSLTIDIPKAQEIKKDIFRELRKPLLEQLDVEFMKALEIGKDTAEISAAKQELRDVTDIPLPDNIEDLESFMPEILK